MPGIPLFRRDAGTLREQDTTKRRGDKMILSNYAYFSAQTACVNACLDIAVATRTIKKVTTEPVSSLFNSNRYGNFWLDMLNFKRSTHEQR